MDITDGVIAEELVKPLQGFTDDGRTQVTDVQRLCHIGSAVVNHDGLAFAGFFNAKIRFQTHFFQIILQKCIGKVQIQKAGHNGFDLGKIVAVQLCGNLLCDLNGGALIYLGSSQCAVALVLAQVGTVGNGDLAVGRLKACFLEGGFHFTRNNI